MNAYEKQIRRALRRKKAAPCIPENSYFLSRVAKAASAAIEKNISARAFTAPPPHIPGDFMLVLTPEGASHAAQALSGEVPFIARGEAQGAFLNLFLNRDAVYGEVLTEVLEQGNRYGTTAGDGTPVIVEYSSPNIAKPLGVNNLRSTLIGESVARLHEYTGRAVLRDNYLGDWGQQFGKLLCAYELWGDRRKIRKNPVPELKELYVEFEKRAAEDPSLEEKARALAQRLETGDRHLTALWKKFRTLSIRDFKKMYGRFGISFDAYGGEHFFVEEGKRAAEACLAKNVCTRGEGGAVVAEFPELPGFILMRSDGATLYHARDLAQLAFRTQELKVRDIRYIVGGEQTLYFRQLFELAKRIGFMAGSEALHVGFGLVLAEGKRMSTRRGTSVEVAELLERATEKAREVIAAKSPDVSPREREAIAEAVGIGAIVYNDLHQSRERDISFDWEKMLNVEGGSAVYLQYTHARILSLLAKVGGAQSAKPIFKEGEEYFLARELAIFPFVVSRAAEHDAPHMVAGYLERVAGLFNTFYGKVNVSGTADPALRASRLTLSKATGQVLKNGLWLLNVPLPQRL